MLCLLTSYVVMLFSPLSNVNSMQHTLNTYTHTYLLCMHMHMHNHSQFLMPGLVCCHIHGEQVENAGANYDKPFSNWLFGDFIRISQKFARNQTYARSVASTIVVCIFCVQILMTSSHGMT